MSEPVCEHCGMFVGRSKTGWVHVQGFQWGRSRCAIGGKDATPRDVE